MLNLAITIGLNLFICFDPLIPFPKKPKNLINSTFSSIGAILSLAMPPSMDFRVIIFLIAAIYCFLSQLAENIFVEKTTCQKLEKKDKKKYEIIEERLGHWPPIESFTKSANSLLRTSDQMMGIQNPGFQHDKTDQQNEIVFSMAL